MGFEAHRTVESIALQSPELPNPIHNTAANRSPVVLVVRLAHDILAVAVPDALLGQELIASRKGRASDGGGIAWVPVQHEIPVRNRLQQRSGFLAGCRVAVHLVLE